tara:strand:+ start:1240 stop:1773 length:534 start_codon:yes stop_codon:yes gene_type:complete
MIWEDTIKKKKYSYKRRKYPSTAQKKNKKLNRLNPAERQKKEEEMREYSRQQQDWADSKIKRKKRKEARKPFEEKINKLKEEKDDIIDKIYNVLKCSKGYKLYENKEWFETMLQLRQDNMNYRDKFIPKFCYECGENLSKGRYADILDNGQETLNMMLEEIEKLKRQANIAEKKVGY